MQSLIKEQSLTPPSESKTSTVLNGIGNGMMIGLLPFLYVETKCHIKQERVPSRWGKMNAAAIILGIIGGALFGSKEAGAVQEYREKVGDEITRLRAQVAENAKMVDQGRDEGSKLLQKDWSSHVRESQLEQQEAAQR